MQPDRSQIINGSGRGAGARGKHDDLCEKQTKTRKTDLHAANAELNEYKFGMGDTMAHVAGGRSVE